MDEKLLRIICTLQVVIIVAMMALVIDLRHPCFSFDQRITSDIEIDLRIYDRKDGTLNKLLDNVEKVRAWYESLTKK